MTSTVAEISHVLFLDLVGYSKETTGAQGRLIADLNRAVSESPTYVAAKEGGWVLGLPTGDGMALLFRGDVVAPARCAIELLGVLKGGPLRVRMGVHSGLVQRGTDISGRENVAGEGINVAQRVMDTAEAGEIMLSDQYAAWLVQFDGWSGKVGDPHEVVAKHGVRLQVRALRTGKVSPATGKAAPGATRVVLLYKRKAQPDETILAAIESHLEHNGHEVFIDRHLRIGVEWAKAIEERIRLADWVIAVVSDSALGSEMLEYELEIAAEEHRRRGKPFILPVRVGEDRPLEGPVGSIVNPLNFTVWGGPEDEPRVLREIMQTIEEPPAPPEAIPLEPVGGAVPPDSPFYVERPTDAEFLGALSRHESILLVKGPRQMGKTSLIGRGARHARDEGWRTAMTDFQKLSTGQLANEDTFYLLLARTLAKSLKFKYDFEEEWLDVFGANMNMDGFVRTLLEDSEVPLVWFMDEADKIFGAPFASDFFGLVRSWHNSRATEPDGPWARFTVVMGYATEAHLFIQDLNQSPFNVGRQIALDDFGPLEVEEMNRRYGAPLKPAEIPQLMSLIGGQPFLVRRALDTVARGVMDFEGLLATADRDDGPFGDHLKRILVSVSQMPEVVDALRNSLRSPDLRDARGYPRLLSAGIVRQRPDGQTELRREVYRRYLAEHLHVA
ncbi:TIR domain-containing protein [bacterium]|nr:MAG: TIR domain-containing protein [bacterium]